MLNEVRHTDENCLPPSAEPRQTNGRRRVRGAAAGQCEQSFTLQ